MVSTLRAKALRLEINAIKSQIDDRFNPSREGTPVGVKSSRRDSNWVSTLRAKALRLEKWSQKNAKILLFQPFARRHSGWSLVFFIAQFGFKKQVLGVFFQNLGRLGAKSAIFREVLNSVRFYRRRELPVLSGAMDILFFFDKNKEAIKKQWRIIF